MTGANPGTGAAAGVGGSTGSGSTAGTSSTGGATGTGGARDAGSDAGGSSDAGGRIGTAGTTGSGGTRGIGGSGGGSFDAGPDACSASADPLRTGSTRADAYDCLLITLAQQFGHPDPMMVKSQIQQESSWNVLATSPDSPCGIPAGWTDAESKSFGLIQVTPACGEARSTLLPNGHPNLTMDMQSALWATSVYNPSLNLSEGYRTVTVSLRTLQTRFAGCTPAVYVLMSAGAFNSGDNAVLGCNLYNARAQAYVTAVLGHYHPFAISAGWPDPY
jgi:hypothetical protein